MVHDLQPGDPQLIGPYRLRGVLGAGGMGRVFLGVSADGLLVAVKAVRAELAADPDFRALFRREVEVARTVGGPFTVPVIDADLDGTVPWLATAYVAGPSLARAVAEDGPLPPGSVLRLAAGLAQGLTQIHAAGVVHRDLKPSNVLLAPDGPRLIDFGISSVSGATTLTGTGLMIGSPGFMSPEQAEGRQVGPAQRHLQPGRGPGLRRLGRRPVRSRIERGADLPCDPPAGGARSSPVAGARAGRALPGQGSRPAAHRPGSAGRGGIGQVSDGPAARAGRSYVHPACTAGPGRGGGHRAGTGAGRPGSGGP
jgi:serine/threonine protein kinase